MNSKMKQGDVWLADVRFKRTRKTKHRFVIGMISFIFFKHNILHSIISIKISYHRVL